MTKQTARIFKIKYLAVLLPLLLVCCASEDGKPWNLLDAMNAAQQQEDYKKEYNNPVKNEPGAWNYSTHHYNTSCGSGSLDPDTNLCSISR